MTAAYYERDLNIRIGEEPQRAPGAHEVRIDVAWCGICGTDVGIWHGKMDWRVALSQIMGHEMAGTVAAIGSAVQDLQVGQAVTVMPLDPCGTCSNCTAGLSHICQNLNFLGIDSPGAFQYSWTVPAACVLPLPPDLDLRHGALIEPIAVACHDVRLAGLTAGARAVVIGGGPIGTLVALVASARGAEVLVCEINPHRRSRLEAMGLAVADPNGEDVPARVQAWTGAAGADVVFEVSAHPDGIALATELPRARGLVVIVGISPKPVPVNLFHVFWKELRIAGARVYEREDFQAAIELAAAGTLPLDAIISATHPLQDMKAALQDASGGGDVLKVLVDCRP
ncbi:MAG: zinc-dependent alcohol dehydrogenase [Planctomycetota bacterium]